MQQGQGEIARLEAQLRDAETSADELRVIEALEGLASAYRRNRRLLDAVNADARIVVLRGKQAAATDSGANGVKGEPIVKDAAWWRHEYFNLVALAIAGALVLCLFDILFLLRLPSDMLTWRFPYLVLHVLFLALPALIVLIGRTRNAVGVSILNLVAGWNCVGWILTFVCAIVDLRNMAADRQMSAKK